MNRKNDHVRFALKQEKKTNDFDRIRFVHQSIPSIGIDDVRFDTYMGRFKSSVPIYINAMTGGTKQAIDVNKKLMSIASTLQIPIAFGSFSMALKDETLLETYEDKNKQTNRPIVIANIGADKTVEDAKKTIELLQPDILQIHVNAPQEIVMPEGERDFSLWSDHIKEIVQAVEIDVIVKEVGFGMSKDTIEKLKKLGVKLIDVSGVGGTDFIQIENNRRTRAMDYLEGYGLSTVESLLEAKEVSNIRVYASGGVRHAFDVVKALSLGAEAVGMSKFFLDLVHTYDEEECLKRTEDLLYEIKEIMVLLNAKNIHDLQHKELIFDEKIMNYIKQRLA